MTLSKQQIQQQREAIDGLYELTVRKQKRLRWKNQQKLPQQ